MKSWITTGITDIDKACFKPIKNILGINKPEGGLWGSPENILGKYPTDWIRWCKEMNFNCDTLATGVRWWLKPEANIYTIDSQEDLINLYDIVGESKEKFSTMWKTLDYENAATLYDGIYVTFRGMCSTHLPLKKMEYSLYGYDVESIILFNFDCIEHWEKWTMQS